MDDISVPPPEVSASATEHLTYDKVASALDGLTPLDLARLDAVERRYLGGTDFAEGDLLQEAMCSALFEEKRCPRITRFIAFLVQSMRNIAGHRRDRLQQQVPIEDVTTGERKSKFELKASGPSPEDAAIRAEQDRGASEVCAALNVHYGADEEMSMVLLGWENDMRGETLRDFLGVDQARLDYVIKKIRRIARREYPKGWRR
ncbi:hypothetical protein FXV83_16805 [Bradyrhizobium hipponense]|uniref:Uncharacterized protein n=1 Tax=Bradyrhizobium hipponense TaxID=2605638 RepID=A0A5S4YPK2_9BRAD|nr:hypothetical protein [Bradyrhizobium hipponense]TYO65357.1 hypothetical protein FXV83_16805 [Bradyrhizobium hipponense]